MAHRVAIFYGPQEYPTDFLGFFGNMKAARKAYEPLEDAGYFVIVLDATEPLYSSED